MNSNTHEVLSYRFTLSVIVIAFAVGTITHTLDVLHVGFFGYSKIRGVSPLLNLFWTALVFVDPLIIILLIVKRSLGIIIGFVVITVDVIINFAFLHAVGKPFWQIPEYSLQVAFLLFYSAALPVLMIRFFPFTRTRLLVRSIFCAIPIGAALIGLGIHIIGLLSSTKESLTLWMLWVHCSMTILDSAMLLTIALKLRIGFWLGMIAFGAFGVLQATLALLNTLGFDIPFHLPSGIALAICCLSVAALLWSRGDMTGSLRMGWRGQYHRPQELP